MAFDFEPSIILETAPQLLGGMKLTLIITLGGLLVGLLLGVVTGLANTSRSRFLRGIAILYIEAIRGTPLIVQVMFLYFGLPLALGMRIPPDVAGVIAIGVNSGAGLAVLLAASLVPGALWLTPLAAFAGALATALVIFALSLGTGLSRLTVVLAGIAITTVFGAGMNTILIVDPDAYIGSSTFLVGGLSGVLMRDLAWPAAYVAVGLAAALAGAAKLNILSLGDEAAHSLGVNVRAVRLGMLAVAAVLAGAAVSFAGLVGFVGSSVPHLMSLFVGHDTGWVAAVSRSRELPSLWDATFWPGCCSPPTSCPWAFCSPSSAAPSSSTSS